jgi:MFS transporter, MHS family, proline/betaine transporter
MGSSFYYVFFGYMPSYLSQQMGFNEQQAFRLQAVSLLAMLILVPLAGRLGDLIGRKKVLLFTAMGMILVSIPCFYLLQTKALFMVGIALALATLLSSLEQGNTLIMVVRHCPPNLRYSGVSFSYNLGNALFGGTAPLIVALLAQHAGRLGPAYYLIAMSIISLWVLITLVQRYSLKRRA